MQNAKSKMQKFESKIQIRKYWREIQKVVDMNCKFPAELLEWPAAGRESQSVRVRPRGKTDSAAQRTFLRKHENFNDTWERVKSLRWCCGWAGIVCWWSSRALDDFVTVWWQNKGWCVQLCRGDKAFSEPQLPQGWPGITQWWHLCCDISTPDPTHYPCEPTWRRRWAWSRGRRRWCWASGRSPSTTSPSSCSTSGRSAFSLPAALLFAAASFLGIQSPVKRWKALILHFRQIMISFKSFHASFYNSD